MWRFLPICTLVSLRTRSLAEAGRSRRKRVFSGWTDVVLVDVRERREREKHGSIPGALHFPYHDLREHLHKGGALYELAATTGKRIVFYCAYGERSAMAVHAAQAEGVTAACHIQGGADAWRRVHG